ncbi:MAG TPA: type II toxin-antitoxin system VapB family antitoxin [Rhizomicrobium sp.]|nr:type II toxin-antitoxin system VapB family antitoxin [Rhizomicrobium sp.]
MPRTERLQLNVRSSFARERAHELAKQTGMTATEVVEDALRGYVPPVSTKKVGRLVRHGPVLVCPASGKKVSLRQANAALEAARERLP